MARYAEMGGNMRLICPNCDAQYEIDGSVIPDTGRDVQCASCGHTWFQEPEGGFAETQDERDASFYEEQEKARTNLDFDENATLAEYGEVGQSIEDTATPELDQSLLDILREEAELETQARRQEGTANLETQPDLGLEEADTAVQRRTARLRGIEQEQQQEKSNSRSDLLPDIEEINSTLRAASDRSEAQVSEPVRAQNRRGFRTGFLLVLAIALIALALYVFAPQISNMVPTLSDPLAGYVDWVNGIRTWLDGSAKNAITNLSDLSGELPN